MVDTFCFLIPWAVLCVFLMMSVNLVFFYIFFCGIPVFLVFSIYILVAEKQSLGRRMMGLCVAQERVSKEKKKEWFDD